MEQLGLLASGAVIVADNVLKPGAPLFLWHVTTGSYDVDLISVREFVQTGIEDWVAVCTWQGAGEEQPATPPPPPAGIAHLAWRADAMRRRSERAGVSVETWANFAQEMRAALASHGLHARPLRACNI